MFEKAKPGLLQAYNKRPATQPFRNSLAIGKFCQWLSMWGEENHQLIFEVIKNKGIRVNEGNWTTCAQGDIPELYAWETLPGYLNLSTDAREDKDKDKVQYPIGLSLVSDLGDQLLDCRTVMLPEAVGIQHAELKGISMGMRWSLLYMDKHKVEKRLVVINDCKAVIDTINNPTNMDKIKDEKTKKTYKEVYDEIFWSVKEEFEDVKFVFVPRKINRAADLLAKCKVTPDKTGYDVEIIEALEAIAKEDIKLKCFARNLPTNFIEKYDSSKGYLLVRQSFFQNDSANFVPIEGGVLGCRGFHSSFRTSQGGLSLNIDVSTTVKIQPGPVVNFLISNQNARDPFSIDWSKLCELVSLQRYTKALSTFQRAALVEKSRQKPQERMSALSNALRNSNYGADPILRSCGVSISSSFTQVEGRVLPAPKLKMGNGEELFSRNGQCNFNNKPAKIERWAVVNFSARCDRIDPPFDVLEENNQNRRLSPVLRVEKMFDDIQSKLPGAPQFLLCLLPDRKNSDLYGPWKRKNLAEFDIVTQSWRTLFYVVSSRQWPSISRYRASVRTQSPKVEMIDSLFKRVSEKEDDGIIRELLLDFYTSSGKRKPDQIIIFQDGVSESQFNQVLNVELDQIIQACKFLDENWDPKFVVIVAQKNHHTKFFLQNSPDNVQPGTVIDNKICHPKNNDFYLCAHAGMIGTTRPTHYHVLLDQIGFSPDDLQELVHSLSYVYQRSTTAISVVAPICYAHLAAAQLGTYMKFEEASETSSSHGGVTAPGAVPVPQLPRLKEKVCSSMFFC
ncbi:Argonaute/Dicer protein, PAZ [Corchorus capsularis]|uniref:Argonaute/Dicer protein, PAZ n=1 Tax=Corchorus capsularis TaxID=210143 RepID=A0A1R3IS05_COCAP|nr:Argonaute/Dicer protein, PAZ [Corchorus capsularis]